MELVYKYQTSAYTFIPNYVMGMNKSFTIKLNGNTVQMRNSIIHENYIMADVCLFFKLS